MNSNVILAIKKVSFGRATTKEMNFVCPESFDDRNVVLYLLSDSYFGIDQVLPIRLKTRNHYISKNLKEHYNEESLDKKLLNENQINTMIDQAYSLGLKHKESSSEGNTDDEEYSQYLENL